MVSFVIKEKELANRGKLAQPPERCRRLLLLVRDATSLGRGRKKSTEGQKPHGCARFWRNLSIKTLRMSQAVCASCWRIASWKRAPSLRREGRDVHPEEQREVPSRNFYEREPSVGSQHVGCISQKNMIYVRTADFGHPTSMTRDMTRRRTMNSGVCVRMMSEGVERIRP